MQRLVASRAVLFIALAAFGLRFRPVPLIKFLQPLVLAQILFGKQLQARGL
jgi:hypothetical protein